jgi:hypothetical protein
LPTANDNAMTCSFGIFGIIAKLASLAASREKY